MLVVSLKEDDRVRLDSGPLKNNPIEIIIVRYNKAQNCVRVGIDAPPSITIERGNIKKKEE